MSYEQNQLPPAECELKVDSDSVYCRIRAGEDLESVVSAAHNEARWALDRGDVLVQPIDVIDVSPK